MRQLALIFTLAASAAAAATDPAQLARAANCGNCHQPEQPMLGPPWQAIADRYAGDEGALKALQARMREGTQGSWGKAAMPPVTEKQLSDDELAAVLRWIINR